MRFFPRNRQTRHDSLVGNNHVFRRNSGDSLTARDRLARYSKIAGTAVALTGTVSATDQATFRAGGTLIYTVSGDDRFQFDAVTARSTLLIAAFAALTGVTLIAGSFALSADGLVLTVTVPGTNTATTGTKAISFDKTLFPHANIPVTSSLVIS